MRPVVALALVVVLAAAAAGHASPAWAAAPVTYEPPVDGPVVDRFRPPAEPWRAGNRGLDFAVEASDPVRAAAAGEVVFAGAIGSSRHVVVLHADGVRTSYSFLESLAVGRGDQVGAGDVVGRAGGPLHFGARAGDRYLDPALLLADGPPRVALVPHGQSRPAPIADERRGLISQLGGRLLGAGRAVGRAAGGAGRAVAHAGGDVLASGAAAVGWARDAAGTGARGLAAGVRMAAAWTTRAGVDVAAAIRHELRSVVDELRIWAHYLDQLEPTSRIARLLRSSWAWTHRECTPAGRQPPPLGERRIALLVGGLGSDHAGSAVRAVDTRSLGYAEADVVQFSYGGGRAPGVGALDRLTTRGYEAADTVDDLRASAAELRSLLVEIRNDYPGVPVDVIAHSQGGIVARLALGDEGDHLDPRLPTVRTVVTLASPHRGADLATGLALAQGSTVGALAVGALGAATGLGDRLGPATLQLGETSALMRTLRDRPLPAGAHVTSIAAAGDLTVAVPATQLDGAHNTTVDLHGPGAHADIVHSSAVEREITLAVGGLPPTCLSFGTAVRHAATGELISFVEDGAGAALGVLTRRLDAGITPSSPTQIPYEEMS